METYGLSWQRFDGGGGTFRQDFKDIAFGDTQIEDYVSIDPDRVYGMNPAEIDVYELKKFGAFAEDGLTTRMLITSSGYSDQWTGFLGTKYDLNLGASCE